MERTWLGAVSDLNIMLNDAFVLPQVMADDMREGRAHFTGNFHFEITWAVYVLRLLWARYEGGDT